MFVPATMKRYCAIEYGKAQLADRRGSLAAFALVIGAAVAVQAAAVWIEGPHIAWANVIVQLSLPFIVAAIARPFAGARMFAVAAILAAGFAAPVTIRGLQAASPSASSSALVAAGMVWVFASARRASMAELLLAATILAAATSIAAFI